MPVMDGYQAVQYRRAAGHTGPIIALTAHAMISDRQRCLDAGCEDYAAKPINRSEFLLQVARYLGVATATAANEDTDSAMS